MGAKGLTKREVELASRIYALSVIAQADTGGMENENELTVANRAIEVARAKLVAIGHGPMGYPTLASCIEAARSRAP